MLPKKGAHYLNGQGQGHRGSWSRQGAGLRVLWPLIPIVLLSLFVFSKLLNLRAVASLKQEDSAAVVHPKQRSNKTSTDTFLEYAARRSIVETSEGQRQQHASSSSSRSNEPPAGSASTHQARQQGPPTSSTSSNVTRGHEVSSLLGPYYTGQLSTVRRRWLQRPQREDLISDTIPREIKPNPIELYGSLAGSKHEDAAKVERHRQAWDLLLRHIESGPNRPKIAIATTTYDNLETIRNWMGYHMSLGIGTFYLFLDGRLATHEAVLRLNRWIPKAHVKLIPRTLEMRDEQGKSRIWMESWLGPFFHKPCNSDLFVKQNLNLEMAVKYAQDDKMDWLLHIDTDELLFPGPTYNHSMQAFLHSIPKQYNYVEIANYEGLPETSNVRDPFSEIGLFKKSHLHLSAELYRKAQAAVKGKNGASYTMAYSNGKSAARVRPGLRPNGAHKFSNYQFPLDKERMNREYWVPHPTAYLAHYVYGKYADLESRRDRCDCLPTEEDAPRCFMLSFDREAFIASSTLDSEGLREWYHDRVVWDDRQLVDLMMKEDVFLREGFFSQRMKHVQGVFDAADAFVG